MEPEKTETRTPIKSLRTYQGDVEEALSKGNASAGTIMIAEQKRREREQAKTGGPISPKRNKLFMITGAVLVLIGILSVGAIYYIKSKEQVVLIQKTKTLISFGEEKTIPVASSTRMGFIKNLVAEKNSFKLSVNSVLYIDTTGTDGAPANISSVLSLLGPNMPASLVRSFENKYMIGVYSLDTNAPFIILTTNDFASSYAGMLKWEKDMVTDLGGLFGIIQDTSPSLDTFSDEALQNKDLRVLKDPLGKIVLLYSFIDKNTLVITGGENVFTAITGKYLISKQTK